MGENHQKVSYNISSEASYIYILSGQKFITKAKIGHQNEKVQNATFLIIFKHCEDGPSNNIDAYSISAAFFLSS